MQVVPAGSIARPAMLDTAQFVNKSTKGDISEYRGPSTNNFPYRGIRLMGAAQLLVAVLLILLTVIQVSIGYGDRFVFLATAAVNVWTPIPAIAAGIVGLSISEKRYWETQCMKVAYWILSLLTACVFMPILLFVIGIVGSYYYDITDRPLGGNVLFVPPEVSVSLTQDDPLDRESTQKAIIGGIIALGLLELIISLIAVFISCCCSHTYQLRDAALQCKLKGAHNPKIKLGAVKTYNDSEAGDSDDDYAVRVVTLGGDQGSVYPRPPQHQSQYGAQNQLQPMYGVLPQTRSVYGALPQSQSMYGGAMMPAHTTNTPSIFVVD